MSDDNRATIHQFKITLDGTKPPVWRRIQLPATATFWDLHCAIQDAMGWEDEHLHAFEAGDRRHPINIGIPSDDGPWGMTDERAGWDVAVSDLLKQPGDKCKYLYDFGDGWRHTVQLQQVLPRETGVNYPRCTAGARACPPEDCGGIHGYARLCEALKNPAKADEDGEELLEWFGDDFDPEHFDPDEVTFHSAARRLKALLSSD
jgi:hypothetical protein